MARWLVGQLARLVRWPIGQDGKIG